MDKRAFKDAMYGQLGRIAKAMAHPGRLEILDLLANGPKPVEQIARETAMSVANVSQHLQVLKREGLLQSSRSGNYVYYSLSGLEVYELWRSLRDFGMRHSLEMKQGLWAFRSDRGTQASVSLQEVIDREDILFLDVRPREEYEAGHLPGAWHLPVEELEQRLEELPRDRLIVTYCRGPFCTYADEAVRRLQAEGFEAIRLEENAIDYELIR
jgi:DNA-binding transcriptional ArsR family regulator/rhodanese-related sulfurtransferase